MLSAEERDASGDGLSELRVLEREVKYRQEQSGNHVRELVAQNEDMPLV